MPFLQVLRNESEQFEPNFNLNGKPSLLGIGSQQPETSYTQQEVLERFEFSHPVVHRFMSAPHIQKRHLILPELDGNGKMPFETPHQLHQKFATYGVKYGTEAVHRALINAGVEAADIDYLCAVTSTGFLVPGLSSRIIKELNLKTNIQKSDIVGMGCNAGVSALVQVNNWAIANPNKLAVLVCVEINSAAYVTDDSVRTGIVNSLFGDNASAIVIKNRRTVLADMGSAQNVTNSEPHFLDFESLLVTEQIDSMKFDFLPDQNKNSFFLSREIPFVIGKHVPIAVKNLLERNQLDVDDVDHWVLHTGGAAVIDSVKKELGLSEYDVRHTRSVLRDFGNVSSGSVLLSFERLLGEGLAQSGDIGVIIAMGPGASIDVGLMVWG